MQKGIIISSNINKSDQIIGENIIDFLFPEGSDPNQKKDFLDQINNYYNNQSCLEFTIRYKKGSNNEIISLRKINLDMGLAKSNISNILTFSINMNSSLLNKPVQDLDKSIMLKIYTQIIIYSLCFIIFSILIFIFIKAAIEETITPFDELSKKINEIKKGAKISIILNEKYRNSSYQYKDLYDSFTKINIIQAFYKNKIDVLNKSQALLDFAEANQIFTEINNFESSSICLNNMGCIHFREKRFREAARSFSMSIEMNSKIHIDKNNFQYIRKTKETIALRKIQLSISLYYLNLNSNSLGLDEAMNTINETICSLKELGEYPDFVILLSIYLSELQIHAKMYLTSSNTLKNARNMLMDLIKQISQINIDKRIIPVIPLGILLQKLYFCLGKCQVKVNKFHEAAKSLTQSLTVSKIIDNNDRKVALELLFNLFKSKSKGEIIPRNIKRNLEMHSYQMREYVIIADCSTSMQRFLPISTNMINQIFDLYIKQIDKIGLIVLDNEVKVMFSLVEKWKNTENLKNQINRLNNLNPSSKRRRIYEGVREACSLLKANKKSKIKNNNYKWIILFVTKSDNTNTITKSINELIELVKALNFLIIILTDPKKLKISTSLQKLASLSKEGLLAINPNNSEVEILLKYTMNAEENIPFVLAEYP